MVTNLEVNLLSTMPKKMLFKEKLAFYQLFVLYLKSEFAFCLTLSIARDSAKRDFKVSANLTLPTFCKRIKNSPLYVTSCS